MIIGRKDATFRYNRESSTETDSTLPEGKADENRQGENVGNTCRDPNEH